MLAGMATQQWRRRHAVATLIAACAAAAVVVAAAAPDVPTGNSTAAAPAGAPARPAGNDDGKAYHHVWPPMGFGWRVVVGSLIGFFGAACGSVGGVGGGGIFVPMLALIVGFDPKSSTAISKCMIMGGSVSTVYYNLKRKHPSLDMPLIDYDLALLMQPMLMLGVSIGVIFNVIFPDWLITALLITIFLVTSTKAYLKGFETWKKETVKKRLEDAKGQEPPCGHGSTEHETSIPVEPDAAPPPPSSKARNPTDNEATSSVLKNIYWKELGLLAFVWIAFLGLQLTRTNYAASCSVWYWVLNSLQVPVAVGVTVYEAYGLRTGRRALSSNKGGSQQQQSALRIRQLLVYCLFGVLAGLVGGLLGMGGGFIMGPLFLELGIPPQVSSATATFTMMFSSSMSVVEYYLLHRFPVPYAAYFTGVAFVAAITGQHCVRKLIAWLGRASLIIFILASMIFVSALTLGGVGISNIVHRVERHQYMGFESLCKV